VILALLTVFPYAPAIGIPVPAAYRKISSSCSLNSLFPSFLFPARQSTLFSFPPKCKVQSRHALTGLPGGGGGIQTSLERAAEVLPMTLCLLRGYNLRIFIHSPTGRVKLLTMLAQAKRHQRSPAAEPASGGTYLSQRRRPEYFYYGRSLDRVISRRCGQQERCDPPGESGHVSVQEIFPQQYCRGQYAPTASWQITTALGFWTGCLIFRSALFWISI
jgi:hypothetical protein